MLNILIPLAGPTPFFDAKDYPFPKSLTEIRGKSMIEHLIHNLNSIQQKKRFIFLLRDEDCVRFHLDETICLLTEAGTVVRRIRGETQGAVCSSLLAIDEIDNENPLMISNGDQFFETSLPACVSQLMHQEIDGGCITFQSTHPRWSYVRLNQDQQLIEAAEKRPISKHAIAGVYLFSRGCDYIQGAKNAISKNANHEGLFYVSSVLNELILLNRNLKAVPTPPGDYITFYSPQKIAEYEAGRRPDAY